MESQKLYDIVRILKVVEGAVLDVIGRLPADEPDRDGGYFCLMEWEFPDLPVVAVIIGEVAKPNRHKYFGYACEKAARTFANASVSSWLTRDEAKDQWGGAIRAGNYYMSFSGLPELADEAAMLLAARRLGWLTKEEAGEIARLSDNRIYLDHDWLVANPVF